MNVSFRPRWWLAIALPLALAACGSSEPDQRAAFKQFLQTRIVDKPGVHVPKLTADESKSFGEYATHYAVITDFNSDMDASVKPLGSLVQKSTVRSLGDVVSRRDDLKAVQSGLNDMAVQLKAQQAKADSAHAQLKQPEDLKAVYDSAYDRTPAPATCDSLTWNPGAISNRRLLFPRWNNSKRPCSAGREEERRTPAGGAASVSFVWYTPTRARNPVLSLNWSRSSYRSCGCQSHRFPLLAKYETPSCDIESGSRGEKIGLSTANDILRDAQCKLMSAVRKRTRWF